ELCYNLARHEQYDGAAWKSLYVSAESPASRIISNAMSFGWLPKHFHQYDDQPLRRDCCTVYGSERLSLGNDGLDYEGFFESLVKTWLRNIGDDVWQPIPIVGQLLHSGQDEPEESLPPDVVVIDSLNVLQPDPDMPG